MKSIYSLLMYYYKNDHKIKILFKNKKKDSPSSKISTGPLSNSANSRTISPIVEKISSATAQPFTARPMSKLYEDDDDDEEEEANENLRRLSCASEMRIDERARRKDLEEKINNQIKSFL